MMSISIALMIWDYHHQPVVEKLHAKLAAFTTPLMAASNAPLQLIDQMAENFTAHKQLVAQNTFLKAQVLILQGQLQRLQALEAENRQLRGLLQSKPSIDHTKLMVAQVIAIHASPFQQQLMINKGRHAGVFNGQAIVDAYGIMGQVIEVMPSMARVLLLSDPRSEIPIIDNRTGLHGILQGEGTSGLLTWLDVPPTADVKAGDMLVTSGLGGHYPVGYPVGTVLYVNQHTTDQFLQIQVTPSAKMYSSEQVLLVWPAKGAK